MTEQPLFTRAKQLINVEIEGKRPQLSERFAAIMVKNNAAGMLKSGATLKQLHRAACEELEDRSKIILAAFARAHGAYISRARAVSRADVKSFTRKCIEDQMAEISPMLAAELRKITDERTIERGELTLSKPTDLIARKLDVEVDLHFDQLDNFGT